MRFDLLHRLGRELLHAVDVDDGEETFEGAQLVHRLHPLHLGEAHVQQVVENVIYRGEKQPVGD